MAELCEQADDKLFRALRYNPIVTTVTIITIVTIGYYHHWTRGQCIEKTRLYLESEQAQYHHEAPHILHVCVTHTTLWLRDLDPHTSRLE